MGMVIYPTVAGAVLGLFAWYLLLQFAFSIQPLPFVVAGAILGFILAIIGLMVSERDE